MINDIHETSEICLWKGKQACKHIPLCNEPNPVRHRLLSMTCRVPLITFDVIRNGSTQGPAALGSHRTIM